MKLRKGPLGAATPYTPQSARLRATIWGTSICTPWDLGDRAVTDRSTQGRHIQLVKEAERGVRPRTPEIDAKRLGEHGVVAEGKSIQIPQALAATQDAQQRQQVPGRKPNLASNA